MNGRSSNGQLATILLIVFTAIVTSYVADLTDRFSADPPSRLIATKPEDSTSARVSDTLAQAADTTNATGDSPPPKGSTGSATTVKQADPDTFPLFRDYMLGTAIVVVIATALIRRYYGRLIFHKWRVISSPFRYDYIMESLEYLTDTGASVSYARHEHATNLSSWRSKGIRATVVAEGSIDRTNTHSINGSFTFPDTNSMMLHCNFHSFNIQRKEHYSSYSTVFNNGFIKRSENWEFAVQTHCSFYEIKIRIPSSRRVESAVLSYYDLKQDDTWDGTYSYRIPQANKERWSKVNDPKILIIKEQDATCILMQVTNFNMSDRYRLNWNLA